MTADRTTLERLRRGDERALAEVYGEHKDRLLTMAYRLLCDRAAAEDCLHDVFLKLVRDAASIGIRDSLSAYLSSCVLNRARDELRKGRRRLLVPVSGDAEAQVTAPGPDVLADERDRDARIGKAMALLPPEQREVVALHLHGGLTFRRIGTLQAISTNTAQSRYRYAIQRLRDLLAGQEEP